MNKSDFFGLWRSSANESVPYSCDFPEALLTLPELIDNALGIGKANNIYIEFDITNEKECKLTVKDDGKGIHNEKRMLDWASKDIGNHELGNHYGHGSKKAMSKFMPIYDSAKWKLYWRKQDKRGLSGSLNILSGPFLGLETKHDTDDDNEDICYPHGTHWEMYFDISVLGDINTCKNLSQTIQELIRTRYEPSYYQEYEITVKVKKATEEIIESSTDWKSLKYTLEDETKNGHVKKLYDSSLTIGNSTAKFMLFEITADGRKFNIPNMERFGKKNMQSSRIHLGMKGRYIEAMPYGEFMGKEQHNSSNGKIGFVMFEGDELPTPCTTKVKFQSECPIFKKIKDAVKIQFNTPIKSLPVSPERSVSPVTKLEKEIPAKPNLPSKPPSLLAKQPSTSAKTPSVPTKHKTIHPVSNIAPPPTVNNERSIVNAHLCDYVGGFGADMVKREEAVAAVAHAVSTQKCNSLSEPTKEKITYDIEDVNIIQRLALKYSNFQLFIEHALQSK